MNALVYLGDRFVSAEQASLSPFDLTVLRGYGVSEYLRTYDRSPFRLLDHLKRLEASAKEVALPLPKPLPIIAQIIEEAIAQVSFKEVGIRILITGGVSIDGYESVEPPQLLIFALPCPEYPKELYQRGGQLEVATCERKFARAKTTDYMSAIIALKKSKMERPADVLLLGRDGRVLETAYANFFGVKGNHLITPKREILLGITRQVVLEIAKDIYVIEERDIYVEELPFLEGAFITATNKGVMPITQVGAQQIGSGKVPPSVRALMSAFDREVLSSITAPKTLC